MSSGDNGQLSPLPFSELWVVDFEFTAPSGGRQGPVCMVAIELLSGRIIRLWADELAELDEAPFDTGPNSLFIAYFASAEIGCFLALGWKLPDRILDLYCEFRAETNGTSVLSGRGLIGALTHFGLDSISVAEKRDMIYLILSGGPWSSEQKIAILDYCETDVRALEHLLPVMAPTITRSPQRLGWALLRGRYMAAVARMEWNGTPIDVQTLERLQSEWDKIKITLIQEIDKDYGIYDGLTFKTARFEDWLVRNDIPWPRLDSGTLALDDKTFRQMAKTYSKVSPLRELRHALGTLRLNDLQVGPDGRNRCLLSPFQSKTGRNQPSNAKFIFGPSVWYRGLIKPARDRAVAYLDWKSQEIAVAAAISGDEVLWEAYSSGDPYMTFAIQAGMAPPEATKETHKDIRNRCKAIVLGVQYGMGAESMALNAGIHLSEARELLLKHKSTYWRFWKWAEQNVNAALLGGTLYTQIGWPIRVGFGAEANTRSLLNWPMQSNGAEMMRLACCEATEAGLMICAPIHDALLLEASVEDIDSHTHQLTTIMQHASELVLGEGKVCGVDVDKIVYPDRYSDERGEVMWDRVMGILSKIDPGGNSRGTPTETVGPGLSI